MRSGEADFSGGEGRRGAVEQPPAKKVKQVCNCL